MSKSQAMSMPIDIPSAVRNPHVRRLYAVVVMCCALMMIITGVHVHATRKIIHEGLYVTPADIKEAAKEAAREEAEITRQFIKDILRDK